MARPGGGLASATSRGSTRLQEDCVLLMHWMAPTRVPETVVFLVMLTYQLELSSPDPLDSEADNPIPTIHTNPTTNTFSKDVDIFLVIRFKNITSSECETYMCKRAWSMYTQCNPYDSFPKNERISPTKRRNSPNFFLSGYGTLAESCPLPYYAHVW